MVVPTDNLVSRGYYGSLDPPPELDEDLVLSAVTVDWRHSVDSPPTANFFAQQTGIVTTWLWSFGAGEGTSTDVNPQHQYVFAGTEKDFVVRLTVNGSVFKEKTITIVNPVGQTAPAGITLTADSLTVEEAAGMTVGQAEAMTVT